MDASASGAPFSGSCRYDPAMSRIVIRLIRSRHPLPSQLYLQCLYSPLLLLLLHLLFIDVIARGPFSLPHPNIIASSLTFFSHSRRDEEKYRQKGEDWKNVRTQVHWWENSCSEYGRAIIALNLLSIES